MNRHEQVLHTLFWYQVVRSSEIMYSLIQQYYIITSPNYGQLLKRITPSSYPLFKNVIWKTKAVIGKTIILFR